MPINLYIDSTKENLLSLCDDSWELPDQLHQLESWLEEKGRFLKPGKYVADIGFAICKGATGGGGVLSSESMSILGKIGMDIYFSEYPSD
ncbi:hypothetical protein [Croceimicrobium sp.]|uniref:hypothetical protein n=1 Tax=Croceimicrobium sp. TaxID=2828340 RepID=UPI003BAA7F2C